ncbi:MAG: hypothetical protein ACOXZ5_01355 [Syntrophomonadaceae bacterium]|jgi:hypothetical protein
MPRRDGTGPAGLGGGNVGLCRSGRGGINREKMGGSGMGLGGLCQCPNCGTRVQHQRGEPCKALRCPQCGSMMVRA